MSKIPSIAMIPSGYKANKVYSVLPTNGDGDLTFARVGEATRVNQLGLIETVATGVPRLDYSDGGCPSLLLEPESRNLITHSEDFTDASWVKASAGAGVDAVVTSNQGISPDGTLNADRIQFNAPSSGDRSLLSRVISIDNGVDYNGSFSVKAFSASDIGKVILFRHVAGSTYSQVTLTNEWQRFDVTELSSGLTTTLSIELRPSSGSSSGVVDLYIWGAQLEEKSYATSYIPTSGGTATREAETTSKTGLSSYINSSEGVLYLETKLFQEIPTSSSYFTISDGTENNAYIIQFRSNGTLRIYQNGLNTSNLAFIDGTINLSQNNKIAFKYEQSSSSMTLYVNGVEISLQGGFVYGNTTGIDSIKMAYVSDTLNLYSEIKDLRIYNQALTDAELAALTTI